MITPEQFRGARAIIAEMEEGKRLILEWMLDNTEAEIKGLMNVCQGKEEEIIKLRQERDIYRDRLNQLDVLVDSLFPELREK